MPLGTIDRTPPPIFRQGYSALTKLVFCAALSLFLMVADTRLTVVAPLRLGLATLLAYPQRAMMVPIEVATGGSDYLRGLANALQGEDAADPGCDGVEHLEPPEEDIESADTGHKGQPEQDGEIGGGRHQADAPDEQPARQ